MLAICVHKKSGKTKIISGLVSYEEIYFNAQNIWYHLFVNEAKQQIMLESRGWKVRIVNETAKC